MACFLLILCFRRVQNKFDDVRGDSDSLAGLILELGGYIPQANDVITCDDFEFTILEVQRNRINKVKVVIKPMVE